MLCIKKYNIILGKERGVGVYLRSDALDQGLFRILFAIGERAQSVVFDLCRLKSLQRQHP